MQFLYILIFVFFGVFDLFSQTVRIANTNLVWQKCSLGQSGKNCEVGTAEKVTWEKAKSYCSSFQMENMEWRLPEKEELVSILTKEKKTPRIQTELFPNTEPANYWAVEDSLGNKEFLNFYSGDSGRYTGSSKTAFVRCVASIKEEIDLSQKPFIQKLKENLPFNWYLSVGKSSFRMERGRKVWIYPGNSNSEPTEKELKKILKTGEQKDCFIEFRVEEKWKPKEMETVIANNQKLEKIISTSSKEKISSLEKQKILLPDYEWDGYYLFIKEETCREDGVHTFYPKEVLQEINQIHNVFKHFLFTSKK